MQVKDQIIGAVQAIAAVGEAIRELGSIPTSILHTHLLPVMPTPAITRCIAQLVNAGLVREENYTLTWIGPEMDTKPAKLDRKTRPCPWPEEWTTTNRLGLYNNDADLFRNAQQSYSERGIQIEVVDGHIRAGTDGLVARFSDDRAARACLLEAGYQQQDGKWTPREGGAA